MRRNLRRTATAMAASVALGIPGPAAADIDIGGQLVIATDYMFRGVSQTMSGAALQGELGVEADNGWYGYVWASNVDFTDSSTDDDGCSVEIDLHAGYSRSVNDKLTVSVAASAYVFPNTKPGFDYNYEELHGALSINDRHSLTIGYSDNVFGSSSTGVFYAGSTGFDLSTQLNFGIELGHYDLEDGYDISYSYAVLSLAGELKSIDWQLSYFTTSDEIEEIFYKSTVSDRLVLALTLAF